MQTNSSTNQTNPSKTHTITLTREMKKELLNQRLAAMSEYEQMQYLRDRLRRQKKGWINPNQIEQFNAMSIAQKYQQVFVVDERHKQISFRPMKGTFY